MMMKRKKNQIATKLFAIQYKMLNVLLKLIIYSCFKYRVTFNILKQFYVLVITSNLIRFACFL